MTGQHIQQEAICYQWFKQRLILSASELSISQRSQIKEDTVEPSVPAREFNLKAYAAITWHNDSASLGLEPRLADHRSQAVRTATLSTAPPRQADSSVMIKWNCQAKIWRPPGRDFWDPQNTIWPTHVNRCLDSVCTTWRKGLRRAWHLPPDMHCSLLPMLSNSLPIIDELANLVVRFIQRWLASDNPIVKFIASYGVHVGGMSSSIGRNVFFCCSRYGTIYSSIASLNASNIVRHCQNAVDEELMVMTSVLFELICIRDGFFTFNFDDSTVQMFVDCIYRHWLFVAL